MNYAAPDYLVPFVLGGTLATIAAILFGLHRAVKLAGWPIRDSRHAVWSGAVLLVTWFFAALLLSLFGLYRGRSSYLPTIQYGVLIPIVVGIVLFWRWRMLQRVVEAAPQEWMVGASL